MTKFDDTIAALKERYGISEDDAETLKDASSLRQELEDERTKRKTAEGDAGKLRTAALKAQFAKHDVGLNPAHLNIPANLDVTDDEQVKDWLVEAGAVKPEPPVSDGEFEQHERVAAAGDGAGPTAQNGVITPAQAAEWSPDRLMRFEKDHPDEFELLMRGQEVTGVVA